MAYGNKAKRIKVSRMKHWLLIDLEIKSHHHTFGVNIKAINSIAATNSPIQFDTLQKKKEKESFKKFNRKIPLCLDHKNATERLIIVWMWVDKFDPCYF